MTYKSHSVDDLCNTLVQMLAQELRLPTASVAVDKPLTQYGLDSIAALTIAGDLEEMLGIELPSTLLWDCPTIDHLARYLSDTMQSREQVVA